MVSHFTFDMAHSRAAWASNPIKNAYDLISPLFELDGKVLPHRTSGLNMSGWREDALRWFQEEYVHIWSVVADIGPEGEVQVMQHVKDVIGVMRPLLALSHKFSKETLQCLNWDNRRSHDAAKMRSEMEVLIEKYNADDDLLYVARQVLALFLDLMAFQIPNDVYKVMPTGRFTPRKRGTHLRSFNVLSLVPEWAKRVMESAKELKAALGYLAKFKLSGYQTLRPHPKTDNLVPLLAD